MNSFTIVKQKEQVNTDNMSTKLMHAFDIKPDDPT